MNFQWILNKTYTSHFIEVFADIIEALVGFYVLNIGGSDVHAIKNLVESLNVEFPSHAKTIHDSRGMSIPNTRAPLGLDSLPLCEEAQERLGFAFEDLNRLFFVFVCYVEDTRVGRGTLISETFKHVGSNPERNDIEDIKLSSLEWIGKTIIDWCKFSISG